jgi:Anion-transporting ATPase
MGEAETSHFDYRSRGTMNDDAAVHPPGFLADPTRFLFFTGKGGVGKTSVACAAALANVDTGKSALLVGTDPASNLDEILDVPLGNLPVAVSGAVAPAGAQYRPHRSRRILSLRVMAQMGLDVSAQELDTVREHYTHVLLVTLAETTPVSQASALQEDLRRAHIEPYAWVINKSLLAAGTRDWLLRQRLLGEQKQIDRLREAIAMKVFFVPWQASPPIGLSAPQELAHHRF